MPDLNARIVVADARVAAVDRRLGLLKIRLYYQVGDAPLQEIEVFSHNYKGWGPDQWRDGSGSGPQVERHSLTVNRLQWQTITSQPGQYFIRQNDGTALQACLTERQIGQTADTVAVIDLKTVSEVKTYL
ncbi:hypothetical protein [Stenomitos frigidus]|uniref:Uncharacterized protein n=1 Tax=Stenomitos frigidus ULC18 TaxID=2107698 RepID=A0A2T1E0F2_9CYAN|nr:hypothetical protein [Stenomitos frigidus]PSB26189.1 hypothetical protein C7B82_20430 [Stenomitos frigidus ULC18]